ncbi:alkaline phosphatase PafA [Zunongwangia endophytica]|uniref:Alkaline phosphatase PafA n=1 Tax=Zunongwangia endophytica TaxID=1808945 RepID=A0ABV8HA42_9FLAO|nr:alkaline phosphatase PafA [Zunongwangia endophytica]MDN3593910.1 alkaline phosphatase family protein [Zunongwangia endophytica]
MYSFKYLLKKYSYSFYFLFLISFHISAQNKNEKPKLVVGIVVDQMREEYLYRYYDKFQDNGFKLLMKEGFMAKNTHYNYVPTKTAPGHASIYTGTTPRYHGIISNSWYHRETKRVMGNVEDESFETVGTLTPKTGKSPYQLIGTNITDELKISSQGKSKVISISLKDRGAILPGGHLADGAYWYDHESGHFITSTYYAKELPTWVQDYNALNKPDSLLKLGWETLLPIASYSESNGDMHSYEKGFPGIKRPTFPYDFKKLPKEKRYELLTRTPYGNTIVRELAEAALKNENMGQSSQTDFLAISFSSTDAVGHKFGPQSVEIEDVYLRLDNEIAALIHSLDQQVGRKNYTLFLTADHGGADTPQYLNETKIPTELSTDVSEKLEAKLLESYGKLQLIESYKDQQIYLNRDVLLKNNLNLKKISNEIRDYLYTIPGVAQVYTADDLRRLNYTDKIGSMVQLGYHNTRSGDIAVVYNPISWSGTMEFGTTHGSPYNYDTHVPLLWFGGTIKKGETVKRLNITAIAPTLAEVLHIKFPSACIGNPIIELFN